MRAHALERVVGAEVRREHTMVAREEREPAALARLSIRAHALPAIADPHDVQHPPRLTCARVLAEHGDEARDSGLERAELRSEPPDTDGPAVDGLASREIGPRFGRREEHPLSVDDLETQPRIIRAHARIDLAV
jgi:hypothetical protein